MQPPYGKPCRQCPWRRKSAPGLLGPWDARDWLDLAHSDEAIACHLTIPEGSDGRDTALMEQCSGAAIFRGNVAKRPRDKTVIVLPRDDAVFTSNAEFLAHHEHASV